MILDDSDSRCIVDEAAGGWTPGMRAVWTLWWRYKLLDSYADGLEADRLAGSPEGIASLGRGAGWSIVRREAERLRCLLEANGMLVLDGRLVEQVGEEDAHER